MDIFGQLWLTIGHQNPHTVMIDLFGKLIFPKHQPWERRRNLRIYGGTFLASLLFALVLAYLLYKKNSLGR